MEENLQSFLAEHAIKAENVKYVASKRFIDKDKNPVEWELRVLTSNENETILNSCKRKEFVPGSRNTSIVTDNDKYAVELACACIVHPNLNSATLQDSYGTIGAADTLKKMLTPGEYTDLCLTVQQANGFELGMSEKIKKVKN